MSDIHQPIQTEPPKRQRFTAQQKQELIDACEASGLSARRFAMLRGIPYQSLLSWRKQLRRNDTNHSALCSLVPAELDEVVSPATATLEVLLSCGARLAVRSQVEVSLAAALIRELQPFRSC